VTDLRYPIGRYVQIEALSAAERAAALDAIAACPGELRRALAGLDTAQLDTPYRDGGWTVRQVAHHLPDSHMNAYVRHKLTVTTERPTILPYPEEIWAELEDGRSGDVAVSLALLESLHDRWVRFLRSLPESAFVRLFHHPDWKQPFTLDGSVAMYAWHGRHHVAQIDSLRQRMGWI
jgi:hypothetical protein